MPCRGPEATLHTVCIISLLCFVFQWSHLVKFHLCHFSEWPRQQHLNTWGRNIGSDSSSQSCSFSESQGRAGLSAWTRKISIFLALPFMAVGNFVLKKKKTVPLTYSYLFQQEHLISTSWISYPSPADRKKNWTEVNISYPSPYPKHSRKTWSPLDVSLVSLFWD